MRSACSTAIRGLALLLAVCTLVGCGATDRPTAIAPEAVCFDAIEVCRATTGGWRAIDEEVGAEVSARTEFTDAKLTYRFRLPDGGERAVRVEGGRNRRRFAFDSTTAKSAPRTDLGPVFLEPPPGTRTLDVECERGLARAVWPFEVSAGPREALVSDTVRLVLIPSALACWCAVVAVLQIAASLDRRSRIGSLLVASEALVLGARFVAMQNHWTNWWTSETAELARVIEYSALPVGSLSVWAFYRWLAGEVRTRPWERVFVAAGVLLVGVTCVTNGRSPLGHVVLRTIQAHAAIGLFLTAHAVGRAARTLPRASRKVVLFGVGALVSSVVVDLVVSLGRRGFVFGVGFVAFGFVIETTCQAVVVAMQNRRAHDRVDELAAELEVKNDALARANESLAGANVKLEGANAVLAAELDERRRLQGELDAATQQLTQAENMATLGMLMAGIAHDLRNPLNYVQGAAEQLRAAIPELRSDDEAKREKTVLRLEKVVGWVEQGTASMDAISLAMRNQARSGGAELADVGVREVVGEALLLCRSRTKSCEVEVDVQDATIRADATGLGQLVMNLVSNAADAIAEARERNHEQPTTIRVRAGVEGEHFTLSVEDSGPGIPEHVRSRILEPFFTTKPRGQGTGLGLAIVQRVVKQHAGALAIARSDRLGGASFVVTWGQR